MKQWWQLDIKSSHWTFTFFWWWLTILINKRLILSFWLSTYLNWEGITLSLSLVLLPFFFLSRFYTQHGAQSRSWTHDAEIKTWLRSRVRHLTDWATQVPCYYLLDSPKIVYNCLEGISGLYQVEVISEQQTPAQWMNESTTTLLLFLSLCFASKIFFPRFWVLFLWGSTFPIPVSWWQKEEIGDYGHLVYLFIRSMNIRDQLLLWEQ